MRKLVIVVMIIITAGLWLQNSMAQDNEIVDRLKNKYCTDNNVATIYKNKDGEIGYYSIRPLILDSTINFFDVNDKHITSFHIFDSDEQKAISTPIIDKIVKEYPVQEDICSADKAK